jgi:hypothetical protein
MHSFSFYKMNELTQLSSVILIIGLSGLNFRFKLGAKNKLGGNLQMFDVGDST